MSRSGRAVLIRLGSLPIELSGGYLCKRLVSYTRLGQNLLWAIFDVPYHISLWRVQYLSGELFWRLLSDEREVGSHDSAAFQILFCNRLLKSFIQDLNTDSHQSAKLTTPCSCVVDFRRSFYDCLRKAGWTVHASDELQNHSLIHQLPIRRLCPLAIARCVPALFDCSVWPRNHRPGAPEDESAASEWAKLMEIPDWTVTRREWGPQFRSQKLVSMSYHVLFILFYCTTGQNPMF